MCPSHISYVKVLSLSVARFTPVQGKWRAIYLLDEGVWNEAARDLCPHTMALLQRLPVCECRCEGC
jgi:hypothetical protein